MKVILEGSRSGSKVMSYSVTGIEISSMIALFSSYNCFLVFCVTFCSSYCRHGLCVYVMAHVNTRISTVLISSMTSFCRCL